MQTVNIHEAKTHLSKLIEKAVRGEPFIIAKAGKPLVQVSAIEPAAEPGTPSGPRRRFGFMKGQFGTPHVFDPSFVDHEIIRMFEGEE